MSDVTQLLEQSRTAHQRSISVSRSWDASGKAWSVGDLGQAKTWIQEALTAREQAEALDPTHTDPGWLSDPVDSTQLLAFYRAHLAHEAES